MAAVNEEITANGASAVFTPTETVSEAIIEGIGNGMIYLKALTPSGSWKSIAQGVGHFIIPTPDVAVTYKFQAENVTGNQRVYMGP